MVPAPDSPYGLANIAKEHYASIYSRLYDLSVVSLRYFNVFGPRQDPSSPYSGVISKFVEALAADSVPRILGDGEQTRDFVFVKDVVQANLLAMHHPDMIGGEIYNIAAGHAVSLLELLQTVNRLNHTDTVPDFGQARPGDIRHSRACINKARSDLGYEPEFTLEEGLSELLAWREKQ
jgi:nucleoside-diphosphate-sugar epimerase